MAFVVSAIWKAQPGEEPRITEVIRTMTPLSRMEEHCLEYQAHVSSDDPTTFFLYEKYTDGAGYAVHKATDHFVRHVLGNVIPLLVDRSVTTYETIED
jgi:quinol monooxygenase YgiN